MKIEVVLSIMWLCEILLYKIDREAFINLKY